MSNQSFKVKSGLTLTPIDLTTLVSPQAGDLACDINDNNKIKKYDEVNSIWSEVSSNSDLDVIFQLVGDDIAQWSTGNNSTFLGGGTIAGTFQTETSAPLNKQQSYKYTQAAGSLNDYFVSGAKSVSLRFRGQTCILSFPFNYNGNSNDIEVILYDATNSAIIPNSMFITSSVTTSILTSYVTIPVTCSSIRVGFKVAVANSGKILNFDDVQLSQTSLYTPQPESQSTIYNDTTNSGTPSFLTGSLVQKGSGLYSISGDTLTALKNIKVEASISISGTCTASASGSGIRTTITSSNGAIATNRMTNMVSGIGGSASSTLPVELNVGETIQFSGTATSFTIVSKTITIIASSASQTILLAPETFSTDTAPLAYSSSYTLSTLNTAPVGTYITFTYAANTNTRTQTATRPTQTDADMNSNGILIYTRAYNAASTAGNPAVFAVQIGKGLKGISRGLYKSTGKITSGTLDHYENSATSIGARLFDYNESTGILYVDAGYRGSSIATAQFDFSDLSQQTSGYLVINASKSPALTSVNTTRTGTLLRITRFTSSGTWTLPNDVGSILVEVQGGGGAGGTGNSPAGGGGGGGGAGGYSQKLISRSSLGATETVTVAAAAGTSSFGSHCSASGGSAGSSSATGAGGAGGVGSNGDLNLNGGGGGGGAGQEAGGAGGMSVRFGGNAAADGSGVGTAAVANSGSGGSGGYNGAGGAGATGVVVVYEYSI